MRRKTCACSGWENTLQSPNRMATTPVQCSAGKLLTADTTSYMYDDACYKSSTSHQLDRSQIDTVGEHRSGKNLAILNSRETLALGNHVNPHPLLCDWFYDHLLTRLMAKTHTGRGSRPIRIPKSDSDVAVEYCSICIRIQ